MSVKTEKKHKKVSIKECVSAVILAVACSFLLFMYAPFEMYFTNKDDFWFDFSGIIGIELILFAVGALALSGLLILCRIIHVNLYRIAYGSATVLFVSSFVEGSILSRNLPMLDGGKIDWSDYGGHRILSALIIILLALAVILTIKFIKFEKFESITRSAFIIIIIALFGSLIVLGNKNNGFQSKQRLIVNKEHEFEYSTDQNIIVLILDAVDADAFEKVLDEHPEYNEGLSDFTYYENMVSTYIQTVNSVPYLLTGVWFKGDLYESLDTYENREVERSALLKRLQRHNFRIGYYEVDCHPLKCPRMETFDNVIKADIWKLNPKSYIKNMIKLVGYRYAPLDLKRFCFVYYRDFLIDEEASANENLYYDYNDDFYKDIQTVPFETMEDKFFKIYHIEGAHQPFVYDKDVNRIEDGTYSQNIEASFTIALKYLNKLKECGVYDNSAIIIMSDHGFNEDDIPEGRLHPIFFAKGFGEHKETLSFSDAPVSFEDFQEALAKLEQGNSGDDIFSWKEGDVRDRKCYVRFYHNPATAHNIQCIQHGHAGEIDKVEVVGK